MATVRDIGTDALRELGVLATGEVATADDLQYAIDALNRLVDQWASERLMIYTVTRTTKALTSGTQNYSVGTGGDFNVARPVFVNDLRYSDSSTSPSQEYSLSSLTDDAWALISQKTLTGSLPSAYYYNPTFPTGTISFWPVPTSTTLTGVLYAPQQVAEFTTLSQTISLPPGYRRMLVKNLAVELGPSYERAIGVDLKDQANDAKTVVKRANTRLMDMSIEAAALGSARNHAYDINLG